MDRPQEDSVTCLVQVCARLEATLPTSSDDLPYCQAVHHDIAAFAAGQTISIIDVGTASVVEVLGGVHSSNIVKVAWGPETGAYGTAESCGQRLASVDQGGKAAVWDTTTASPLAVCNVIPDRRKQAHQAAVVDMAWGSSTQDALLVLVEPATMVVINATTGAIIRSQTIAQNVVLTSIEVDSWQPSSLALTSMSQALFVARLEESEPHRVPPTSQISLSKHEVSVAGQGLMKARWVANRGVLLLMQLNHITVYGIESKSTLTRIELPAKHAPFAGWLTVQGSGACLGTGDDGGANTLVCEHEGGAVSVWHDPEGNLKYSLQSYHRLQPTIKSDALGLQSSIVSLIPCLPGFTDSDPAEGRLLTGSPDSMWLLAVMSGGQLWRWRLPLPTPATSFESLCSEGGDTAPTLDARTAPSIESLIKLSPSAEIPEPPHDARRVLAHSRSLSRRSSNRSDASGPLATLAGGAREASASLNSDASGPIAAPPRQFLVDNTPSKRSGSLAGRRDAASTMPLITAGGSIAEEGEEEAAALEAEAQAAESSPGDPFQTPDAGPGKGGQLGTPSIRVKASNGGQEMARTQSVQTPGAGMASDCEPAMLEMLNSGLPAGATSLSVFPALVPTGNVNVFSRTSSRSGPGDVDTGGNLLEDSDDGQAPLQATVNVSDGSSSQSVSLLAVGTSDGTVEVVSASQGAVQPLALNIIHCFKVANTKTLSVHWLGTTLRFAAMTCTSSGKPESQRYAYTVSVTDLVSTKTVALLRESDATEPLVALRACPNGRYLAIMPRAGGLQVWCVPIMGKAVKVRTVELPFVAMAWVTPTPQEIGHSPMFTADMEAVAWPAHYKRQAVARQSSGGGLSASSGNGATPKPEAPEAQAAFCFAVSDGRLGSITVTDRGVKKRPVTAPHWTVQYVDRLVVTSIAAMGDLVFIGDSEGVLYQWNTVSGQTMVVPAGRKVIRKISVGPPMSPALKGLPMHTRTGLARLVLLYGDGALGVWDVHDASSLEGGRCEPIDKVKLSRFVDAIWLPLPKPLSGGCVCAAISKNSGAVLLDMVDASTDDVDATERRQLMHRLVRGEKRRSSNTADPDVLLGLAPARDSSKMIGLAHAPPCHTLRLLPPTIVTFLRLVFEAGVPVATLSAMGGEDADASQAAAKSLCRFVLRIPRGASDNDQERAHAPSVGATSLLPKPSALDATGLLPGLSRTPEENTAALPAVELHDAQAVLQAIDLNALVGLVKRIGMLRTGAPTAILLPHEAAAYESALASKNPRERACRCIAFAAALMGCTSEARFWSHLHATLAGHDARGGRPNTTSDCVTLFPYSAAAADAQRRVRWHEQVADFVPSDWVAVGSNPLLDRRMLEYVSIGDFASAAALMMGEAPTVTGTFYRNAVLSIALAGGATGGPMATGGGLGAPQKLPSSRGFQVQTLKVVAEHAREIGDMTMCVVLLCAAGRHVEAVTELQAMDDWQTALSLAERFLSVPERNALLHARAKAHNMEHSRSESIWRTVGLFTAAGSLRSAAAVLRGAGLTAAACNFTRICSEMSLVCSVAPGSALESALPESARAKIANPGKRSWLEGGDMRKRSNGLLRSSRGGEPLADVGVMLGWVHHHDGHWIKEGAGEKGQEGLDPEAAVLVNFDAPEPIDGGVLDEQTRRLHGEVIQDEDRVAQMLSDQRQHVLYVLMELCKSGVW